MLKSFFEDKFVPVAAKIAKQRHLLAMRDGLVLSLPLLIVVPCSSSSASCPSRPTRTL